MTDDELVNNTNSKLPKVFSLQEQLYLHLVEVITNVTEKKDQDEWRKIVTQFSTFLRSLKVNYNTQTYINAEDKGDKNFISFFNTYWETKLFLTQVGRVLVSDRLLSRYSQVQSNQFFFNNLMNFHLKLPFAQQQKVLEQLNIHLSEIEADVHRQTQLYALNPFFYTTKAFNSYLGSLSKESQLKDLLDHVLASAAEFMEHTMSYFRSLPKSARAHPNDDYFTWYLKLAQWSALAFPEEFSALAYTKEFLNTLNYFPFRRISLTLHERFHMYIPMKTLLLPSSRLYKLYFSPTFPLIDLINLSQGYGELSPFVKMEEINSDKSPSYDLHFVIKKLFSEVLSYWLYSSVTYQEFFSFSKKTSKTLANIVRGLSGIEFVFQCLYLRALMESLEPNSDLPPYTALKEHFIRIHQKYLNSKPNELRIFMLLHPLNHWHPFSCLARFYSLYLNQLFNETFNFPWWTSTDAGRMLSHLASLGNELVNRMTQWKLITDNVFTFFEPQYEAN